MMAKKVSESIDGVSRGNTVVLRGTVSREVRLRELAGGQQVVEFSLRTADESNALLPIVWPDAPQWVQTLKERQELLLLGHARQRFFAVNGVRQTRTEIVVERGCRSSARAASATLIEFARIRVGDL
jgi:hypothetical protein